MTAASFAVSWWMVRAAVTEACLLWLPDVDQPSPRVLGIDEHWFWSVRYIRDPPTRARTRSEPRMTTIINLDTAKSWGPIAGAARLSVVKGRRGRAVDKAWPTGCCSCSAATRSAAGQPAVPPTTNRFFS